MIEYNFMKTFFKIDPDLLRMSYFAPDLLTHIVFVRDKRQRRIKEIEQMN